MTYPRITLTLLLFLTLPFSVLAMEAIPVAEAIQAADRELSGDNSYQHASVAIKKQLRNAAIRRQIVAKTKAELDAMQIKLNLEFDVRLAKAYDADSGYGIDPAVKNELISRFKAEMYLYMAENRSSLVKLAYINVEGDSGNVKYYLEQAFKDKVSFGNDIESILTKISGDLKEEGYIVNGNWISEVKRNIIRAFNK